MLTSLKDMYFLEPDLFSGVYMPTILPKLEPPNQVELDKSEWVNNLMLQCGDMPVICMAPAELRKSIASWSLLHQNKWERMADTMHYDFNPTHNFDRFEEYTDSDKSHAKGGSTTSDSGTAFPSEDLKLKGKVSGESTAENSVEHKHTGHLYGNIGVTTTTAMLRESYEFAKLNVYQEMISDFKEQFLIMIYC